VVVLPEPFGPIRPTMRPAGISKLMPSTATALAVMLAQALGGNDGAHARPPCWSVQQVFDVQAELADTFQHRRPFFAQEALPFAGEQFFARAFRDIHTDPPSFFY
jgi:hypothetical protein